MDDDKDSRYQARQKGARKHYARAERRGVPPRTKKEEMYRAKKAAGDDDAYAAPAEGGSGGSGGPSRKELKAIAEDTLARLEMIKSMGAAIASTVQHDGPPPLPHAPPQKTSISILTETTTLKTAHALSQNDRVTVLNFASAKSPGGGFLKGSSAQEESLARSSGLYPCLTSPRITMYRANKADNKNYCYHNMAVFSPNVPVLKNDDGELLLPFYTADFITCPAVNAGHAFWHLTVDQIDRAMRQRIELILSVAVHHAAETLILGAFGCGVFRNDPRRVANIFQTLLGPKGDFHGRFRAVVFAMHGKEGETIDAFQGMVDALQKT